VKAGYKAQSSVKELAEGAYQGTAKIEVLPTSLNMDMRYDTPHPVPTYQEALDQATALARRILGELAIFC
jgi:hypothetical protein